MQMQCTGRTMCNLKSIISHYVLSALIVLIERIQDFLGFVKWGFGQFKTRERQSDTLELQISCNELITC